MASLLKTLINRSSKWNSTTMAARQLSRLTIQIRNHTIKSMLDIVASEFPGYNNAIPPSAVSTYNKVYKNEYISENNARKRELLLELTEGFYAGKWKFKQMGTCKADEYRSSLEGCGITTGVLHDLKAIEAAKFAISKLNEQNNEEKNVEFVKLVRVNVMSKSGRWYYLTIEASDNNFYEARVFCHHDEKILDFIRPAIHYPQVNPEFLKYDAPDNNERSHINPRFHIDLGTGRASSPFANDYVSKINCWKCKQLLDLTEGFYAGSWILKLSDKREPNEFWPRLDGAVFVIGDIMDFKPMEAAKFAISKLNEQDKEGKNVELVSLWRVNRFLGNGMWYYLTFEASDKKFYEAKVFVNGDVRNLDFIRLAVHFPQVNPEFLKYDVPKEMLNNRPSIQIWACGRGLRRGMSKGGFIM